MKLRGIDFGNVWAASGVQGFFGEGYWFHHLPWGPNFNGVTFVSKTATTFEREGNMPLNDRYEPKDWFPSCVKVNFRKGMVVNAVGLSNPGLSRLLSRNLWQQRKNPFLISIMAVGTTRIQRLAEIQCMVDMLCGVKETFSAPFGLQINLSCPNTGHDVSELIAETERTLEIAAKLDIPLVPKYAVDSASLEVLMELNKNSNCDAICFSNAPKFSWNEGNFKNTWGTDVSPLEKLGGGGVSGRILHSLVTKKIGELREKGFTKPINGGGGILKKSDIDDHHRIGSSSVFLGSVAILRPWRVRPLTNHANALGWR